MNIESKPDFNDLETAFSYKSDAELKKANFLFSVINNSFVSKVGSTLAQWGIKLRLPVKGLIRKTVFSHFCGGESIRDCFGVIDQMGEYNVQTILDYSVEGEATEDSFEYTKNEILRVIDGAANHKNVPFAVFKMTGLASFKLMALLQEGKDLDQKQRESWDRAKGRVFEICEYAASKKIPIMFDAEETWIQDTIDELCYDMMRKFNKNDALVFNTYQLYRTDGLANLMSASKKLHEEGFYFGTKLVRGAYMEKERDRAKDKKYKSPIHENKEATDRSFNEALRYCVENVDFISVVCGSHNEESNSLLASLIHQKGYKHDDQRFWFAQLYGMSDNISFNLGLKGYNVAKYVPYGPIYSVMPYLIRRAEENTSVEGQSSRELTMIKKELKRRVESNN